MATVTVTVAVHAMATRFEIVLHGDNPARLRAAGEEALLEIEHLEAQLSLFVPTSEIAHVNAGAARAPVRVSPSVFALLQHAKSLHHDGVGAFDITIAPLVRCWGFMGGTGRIPDPKELVDARNKVGMDLVHLNLEDSTVRFEREGVMLDLGAIGKGYAIERAAEILRDAGVTSALLHGGTSTVQAIGHPPEGAAWNVAIENPLSEDAHEAIATVALKDEAMSVSGIRRTAFEAEGKMVGHIIDPRTGEPATNAVLAVVVLHSATESDALSTALLTLGPAGLEEIAKAKPEIKALVGSERGGTLKIDARGIGN